MRKILLLILVICSIAYSQAIRATVSNNAIQSSDVFTFKVEAVNAESKLEVNIAPISNDFSIISGPAQQTSMQWINGKSTSSRSLSWSVVAKRKGELTIPALSVKIGKETFKTDPIVMKVSDSDQEYQTNELFLTIEIDKNNAVVGEQITATYKIYTRVNMSIQNIEFPKHSGFWTEELFVPQTVDFKDAAVEGINYKVATLYRLAMFPTKSGSLELSPMIMNCNVVVKRGNSLFNDPFFGSFGNQTMPKVLRTEKTVVNVREFPGTVPSGFTGAVGDFAISSSLTPKEIKANNAVTLKFKFSGTGNIDVISLPELEFPQNIEVFPPTSKTEREPFRDQITGTITKEYILIPRKTGRYEIPKMTIPYFNPLTKVWRSVSTKPIEVLVNPDDSIVSGSNGLTKQEVELLGEDIRYIRADAIKWKLKDNQYLIFGIYLLSLVLLILPSIVFKIKENRLSSEDFRKSKSALRRAYRKLSKKDNDQFTNSSNAVYGYLKDKFQLSSDKLDPLKVKSILEEKIKKKDVISEVVDLLKICDAGRFAPEGNVTRGKLIKKTKKILKKVNALL